MTLSFLGWLLTVVTQGAEPQVFLDQTKDVPPRLEWSREIVTKKGGKITFTIESVAPVSILFLTARGHQAMVARDIDAMERSDLILNVVSVPTPYTGTVTAPPGSSWFVIENLSDKPAKMRLKCAAQ